MRTHVLRIESNHSDANHNDRMCCPMCTAPSRRGLSTGCIRVRRTEIVQRIDVRRIQRDGLLVVVDGLVAEAYLTSSNHSLSAVWPPHATPVCAPLTATREAEAASLTPCACLRWAVGHREWQTPHGERLRATDRLGAIGTRCVCA